jgi:hypothetical protein
MGRERTYEIAGQKVTSGEARAFVRRRDGHLYGADEAGGRGARRIGMTEESARTQIATLLADALGDILKHGDDYATAHAVIAATLAEPEVRQKLPAVLSGLNLMEATPEDDRPTEAVAQLRDISSWLEAEGDDELMVDADALADSIASAYEVE